MTELCIAPICSFLSVTVPTRKRATQVEGDNRRVAVSRSADHPACLSLSLHLLFRCVPAAACALSDAEQRLTTVPEGTGCANGRRLILLR